MSNINEELREQIIDIIDRMDESELRALIKLIQQSRGE